MFHGHELSTRQRLARRALALVATVAVNAVLSMALMVMFHSASRLPWLAPTADNLARLARCDTSLGSSARHACVEQVIASVQARDAAVQVAERSTEASKNWP
jgi:hypothetical protein